MKSEIETINEVVKLYEDAVHIIDIEGEGFIEKYLDRHDSILFQELVDEVFSNKTELENQELETLDLEIIEDWKEKLDTYLSFFPI